MDSRDERFDRGRPVSGIVTLGQSNQLGVVENGNGLTSGRRPEEREGRTDVPAILRVHDAWRVGTGGIWIGLVRCRRSVSFLEPIGRLWGIGRG